MKTSPAAVPEASGDPRTNLGSRLRDVRIASGMSLREVSRQIGVSASFVSQLENGKSQPSVTTLYSFAQLFGITLDDLFNTDNPLDLPGLSVVSDPLHEALSRTDLVPQSSAFPDQSGGARMSLLSPEERSRLVMDTGVIWEQLANNGDHNLNFIEVTYPAGSSSTTDGRMLRHEGYEYGYLLSGQLEITFGFEKLTLREGQSLGFNSSVPHLLTNTGRKAARGIWVVHQCAFSR